MSPFNPTLGLAEAAMAQKAAPVIKLDPNSFFLSEVVDTVAHLGIVIVSAAGEGPIQGICLAEGTSQVFGVRRIGMSYPVGTPVLCYRPAGFSSCFVLASVPTWITDPKANHVPEWIVPGCFSGVMHDRIHNELYRSKSGKTTGLINFGAGRPLDDLPGDYGHINELGVGYGLGRAMAWLRASHFCGIEAFWIDNLLRLKGLNYELLTAASELRAYLDEGEWSEVARWSPYVWEALGLTEAENDFTRDGSGDPASGETGREPHYVDQVGLWRVQRFRGYLGDLERTIVALVRPADVAGPAARRSAAVRLPGVLDAGTSANGLFRVASAKGILLEKSVAIPVPRETKLPDDATGDNPTNYRAAGALGSGPAHDAVPVEIPAKPGARTLLLHERHAVEISRQGNVAFRRHQHDWDLPTEQDAVAALQLPSAQYQPDADIDDDAPDMPAPRSVEVDVDHRGKAKYFTGRSLLKIDDDGSIVLEDAWGSQIIMRNGHIILSPRLDLRVQAGRNLHVLASNDAVVRGGASVDISASQGDLRLKAQGNLMAAAVEKGVLIESQATRTEQDWKGEGEQVNSSGVTLKSEHGTVSVLAQDAYIRAGIAEGREAAGRLHLDSGKGEGELALHGGQVITNALREALTVVGTDGDSDTLSTFLMTPTSLVLGGNRVGSAIVNAASVAIGRETGDSRVTIIGDEILKGDLLSEGAAVFGAQMRVNGSAVFRDDIRVLGGAVITGQVVCGAIAAERNKMFVLPVPDDFSLVDQVPEHPDTVRELVNQAETQVRDASSRAREQANTTISGLVDYLYAENGPGGPTLIYNMAFSFRTPEEYGTKGMELPETRWQEMNRKLFGQTSVWQEPTLKVKSTGRSTMPYPGFEVWNGEDGKMLRIDDKAFDFMQGVSADRDSEEDAGDEIAELQEVTPAAGYIVTKQRNPHG